MDPYLFQTVGQTATCRSEPQDKKLPNALRVKPLSFSTSIHPTIGHKYTAPIKTRLGAIWRYDSIVLFQSIYFDIDSTSLFDI
ncbi:hypothetical protein [Acetobacter cibinongensis]|uniref:hypothetical protein n=1 Tax=Acetobacter cibinongensis TaxID=146475 RepID=UPI0013FDB89E|nr:hypothetical protein [Acetobacter cibinongensis]